MPCPNLEELLQDGGEHAARCEHCRALLDAWADVDATLEAAFAGISAPPRLAASAARLRSARGLSYVPEVLDFIGWAAVLAIAAVLLPRFLPVIEALRG